MLLLGGGLAVADWGKPLWPARPGGALPLGQWRLDLVAGLLLIAGCLTLLALIRRVPRLSVGADGVTYQTMFRRLAVPWDRLGPFTTVVERHGWGQRQAVVARAQVIAGPERRARELVLRDQFDVPLAGILAELPRHRGVRAAPAVIETPVAPFGVPGFGLPWLTLGMLVAFAVVFWIELRFATTPPVKPLTPSVDTLTALGGLSLALVREGESFRLLTAPFLHAGLAHLLGNCVAFGLAGYALERAIGRAWTFCLFALGAMAGSAMSLVVTPASTVSVGASGAIMAMLAGLLALSFRFPPGRYKLMIRVQAARIAIPALVPFQAAAGAAVHVDYGAHLGGALAGAGLGLLLLLSWQATSPLPAFRGLAIAFAAVACVSFGGSAYAASRWYWVYQAVQAERVPAAEAPHTAAEIAARADALVARYPRDPVAQYYAAAALLQRHDRDHAEWHLREALALAGDNPRLVRPAMINTIHATLALVLLGDGRRDLAVVEAAGACAARGDAAPLGKTPALLAQFKLCGAP